MCMVTFTGEGIGSLTESCMQFDFQTRVAELVLCTDSAVAAAAYVCTCTVNQEIFV